jgi:hypothetical protein
MSDANLPSPNNLGYLGSADPTTVGDHFNALSFIAKQVLSGAWTVTGDCLGDLGGAAGGLRSSPACDTAGLPNRSPVQNVTRTEFVEKSAFL